MSVSTAQVATSSTVTKVTGPIAGTLSSAIAQPTTAAPQTTFASATNFGVGNAVIIDAGTALAETRVVTAVTGAGPFTHTVGNLGNAHNSGAAVSIVGDDNAGQNVLIAAPSGNTAPVFIGNAGVTAATGYPLAAGASFPANGQPLQLNPGEDLYVVSAAAQTVNVFRQGL